MSNRKVRIAFLSDLHAYHPMAGGQSTSYLTTTQTANDPKPFQDLQQLIKTEKIEVDLVLCGGDICDKADLNGFQYAWGQLHQISKCMSAKELIATCGNHDLNSRHNDAEDDPDPKGAIQTIEPQFPFESDELTNQFWARNFAELTPIPGVRIVVLNTSAYHGGGKGEDEHGRVSKRTIEAIQRKLSKSSLSDLNILLCHHHVRPLKGLWGTAPDHEYMHKGGELLGMLTNSTASPWLVLHGHRHTPNLEHSFDPACTVIGASSFSAKIPGKLNQFHILDITIDHSRPQPLTGTIDTWSWTVTNAWARRPVQNDEEGFPPQCGFGSQFQPRAIADKVTAYLGVGPNYKAWDEMSKAVPDMQFMTPTHFRQLEMLLESDNIKLHRDRLGILTQIGRSV